MSAARTGRRRPLTLALSLGGEREHAIARSSGAFRSLSLARERVGVRVAQLEGGR